MPKKGSYDLAVVGATPAGIATAVRGAREGLDTVLITYNAHVGGMMAGGLSVTDTLIEHTRTRSTLLNEFFDRVRRYYRETYGPASAQYKDCCEGLYFEPKVAELIFDDLLKEADVEVHQEYHPVEATRSNRTICRVQFEPIPTRSKAGTEGFEVRGETFVDATYEGDLAAVAGVPYRIGREGRDEYGEQYAGRLFSEKGTRIFPGSTGVGDDTVQSYDYRVCLSKDPDNRRLPERPPGYDREEFLPILEDGPDDGVDQLRPHQMEEIHCPIKSELAVPTLEDIEEQGLFSVLLLRGPLPNEKRDLNTADLPGEADEYPEGDWEQRAEIEKRHEQHVLGLLYFLQNDESVPKRLRDEIGEWGLPLDEFEDNNGFPFQLYVREGRRIKGRATFTEHDARSAEGIERAPIQEDAIGIAEYAMDSHDCRPVRRPGSLNDGHHYLGEITVPSQVPYRTLLAKEVDNLLVPVALSATHVGFGTIRLEPTWMQIGEAAGWAAALAADTSSTPGELNHNSLQRRLVEDKTMMTFFDDVDVDADVTGADAAQYLGTKGFFSSYEARLREPLDPETATQWAELTVRLVRRAGEDGDPSETPTESAKRLPKRSRVGSITASEFKTVISDAFERAQIDADAISSAADRLKSIQDEPLSRGEALTALHDVVLGTE